MTREEAFLRDYRNLRCWADQNRLRLRNHTSLIAVANNTDTSIRDRIIAEIGSLETTESLLASDKGDAIVMLGSQFGSGIALDDPMLNNRKVAFIQMSVLSGHYAGIALYSVENGRLKGPSLEFSI